MAEAKKLSSLKLCVVMKQHLGRREVVTKACGCSAPFSCTGHPGIGRQKSSVGTEPSYRPAPDLQSANSAALVLCELTQRIPG